MKHTRQYTTQSDIDAYKRDGVVCLRGVFDAHWLSVIEAAWLELQHRTENEEDLFKAVEPFRKQDPLLDAEMEFIQSARRSDEKAKAGKMGCKWMFLWHDGIRDFVLNSPAAQIVGEVLDVEDVRFFWDQMFVKKAGGGLPTYWHTDLPAWPVQGTQIPSLWVPISPVDATLSSLEYIPGSHLGFDGSEWPKSFNAKGMDMPPGRAPFKDIESMRAGGDLSFLSFDMEPGDAILFDPRLYHGGGANNHPSVDRIALSTRWMGPDITWDPRPECSNLVGLPKHQMVKGAKPDDDTLFPLVWTRDASVGL